MDTDWLAVVQLERERLLEVMLNAELRIKRMIAKGQDADEAAEAVLSAFEHSRQTIRNVMHRGEP